MCIIAKSARWKMLGACALVAGMPSGLGTPAAPSAVAFAPAAIQAAPAVDPRRVALADYLADRYRIGPQRARVFVEEAHAAAEEFDVDPLLVLAVMAVESSFNPAARSDAGARGLMQVIPRFHRDKLDEYGGEGALLDPRVNALVGTQILKDYLRRAGSLRAALQRYAGWQDDDEQRYATRVITEKERLRRVGKRAAGEAKEGSGPPQGS